MKVCGVVALAVVAVVALLTASAAGSYNVIYYNNNNRPIEDVANTNYTHLIMGFAEFNQQNGICASPTLIFSGNLQGNCAGGSNPNWATVFASIKAAGKKIMFSLGGAAGWDSWWQQLSQCSSTELNNVAAAVANFIKGSNECNFQFDGVDLDPEGANVNALLGSTTGLQFFANFIFALRAQLPSPTYWISHAPQVPYICPVTTAIGCPDWASGSYFNGYAKLMTMTNSNSQTVLQVTDFISVQYYPNSNLNCPFTTNGCGLRDYYSNSVDGYSLGGGTFSVPASKLVIGLPACPDPNCAATGFLQPSYLTSEVTFLLGKYSNFGGLMGWEFGSVVAGANNWDTITSGLLGNGGSTSSNGATTSGSPSSSSSSASALSDSWVIQGISFFLSYL